MTEGRLGELLGQVDSRRLTPDEAGLLRAAVRILVEERDYATRHLRGAENALRKARRRIDAVRALHRPDVAGTCCEECRDADSNSVRWRCPTIRALDGIVMGAPR
ncbi:hypothetical protein [Kitasatospora atroaurantiaca]|uniref:Uncharacterized protein n=1 Tax=Kitasatospora atroaurantiaca TaxID=285545 RepID=A0A561ENB5_9ACTN|nr:hypothetical protein [Kitasatospora atroaurantiaca]TWE17072.1 hypothetical protein FB465_2076 [Kitasatospora atroaurantiaca]